MIADGSARVAADPITTEVVRHGLNSAAEQMRRALIRTAFSPVIYEVIDFAVAIYDRQVRLLGQAPGLTLFMGTLGFSVEAAVKAVGGEEALEEGDIILLNSPYDIGSHQNDVAMVMPIFSAEGKLLGYSAVKGHWLDIGGKEPYSTDTVDVYQEGTIFPGVKLYKRGKQDSDLYRTVLANSRLPVAVGGDINAMVVCLRTGAAALVRLVERHGEESFAVAVEGMFDHGEAVVRSYLETIPDGRYVGHGVMDDDGLSEDPIPFEVVVDVSGSNVRVDYTNVPDAQAGPVNCPVATTVSATRVAITMLVSGKDVPTEGHLRAIDVVTRPGSMFHAEAPSPCFLYAWPAAQAMEAIYNALAKALPDAVPACSGGDFSALIWWGVREATGEMWGDGFSNVCGQGAYAGADGANAIMHIGESATRLTPVEVWEARNPWLVEKLELATDSCGAGAHRGGLGVDLFFHMLEDAWLTTTVERTKAKPWGLSGGGEARPNTAHVQYADGRVGPSIGKYTRLQVPKGATFKLYTGGGGGYGSPGERSREDVLADVAAGYITEERARADYPHAFAGGGA